MSSQVGDRPLPDSWCLEMDLFVFLWGGVRGYPPLIFLSGFLSFSLSEVPGPQSIPFPIRLLNWQSVNGSLWWIPLSLWSVWDHTQKHELWAP